jgi:PAS domain S-box-containing protein
MKRYAGVSWPRRIFGKTIIESSGEFMGIIQGSGPKALRQPMLGTVAVPFSFSFIISMAVYWKNREAFLNPCSCTLALTSTSLIAFFVKSSLRSPDGWAGMSCQYSGGIYYLVANVTAVRSAQAEQTTPGNVPTASFSTAEEKFRALAESAPDVIRRFDRQGRHIYVNTAGLRLYRKPADLIKGRTMEEAGLPLAYFSRWRERIQNLFRIGRPIQVEEFHQAENGPLFLYSRCVPEFGLNRIVAHVLVVSRNLTQRKQLEQKIRKTNENRKNASGNAQAILFSQMKN